MGKKKRWIAELLVVGLLFWFGSNLSAAEDKNENIKIGPVYLGLNAGLSLRWTDNIGLNDHNTESDWSATTNLGLLIQYPITEHVLLGLNANFGYTRWADHDDVSGGLTGTSALSFDIPMAGWKVNLHDRYTRATNPISKEDPFIDSVKEFNRSSNTAGIAFLKEFNKVKLGLGYDFVTYRTETKIYKDLERDTHQVFVDLAVAVNPKTDFFTRYANAQNKPRTGLYNDSSSDRVEAGLRGRMTSRLTGEVAVGYEQLNFEENGAVTDRSDYDNVTYRAQLTHRTSNLTSQSLALNYQPEYGYSTEANYYNWFNTTYTLNHRFTKRMSGHLSYGYDHTSESRGGNKGEKIDRFIAGVGASWQVSPKATFSLDYTNVDKDSGHELFSHGYQQNNVTATFNYTF